MIVQALPVSLEWFAPLLPLQHIRSRCELRSSDFDPNRQEPVIVTSRVSEETLLFLADASGCNAQRFDQGLVLFSAANRNREMTTKYRHLAV